MSHPFRFYGARPGDWFEGANCGHFWEVQFREPPDAAARATIAEVFGRVTAGGAIDCACQPWLWAGAWTLVCLGEAITDDEDADFWMSVQEAWKRVHEAVPIEEIHFGGTREPWRRDTWSVWSVESKPVPGPCPAWDGLDLDMDIYGSKIERFAVEAASDDAFEAARDAAHRAALAES